MASRLLSQLDARIAAATHPPQRAVLRIRRALHQARQGRGRDAQAVVDAIRTQFAGAPDAGVTAWLCLCEGVIEYHRVPGPAAHDRTQRAHALARAIGDDELVALSAAWLAHMAFNDDRIEPMLQHAEESLRRAAPTHHAALARVSLVLADAYHHAGRHDLAQPWYARVREHALAEGDDAMISAMLYNVAAIRTAAVRVAHAFGRLDPVQLQRATMEVESHRSYDAGSGSASLPSLQSWIEAQLQVMRGRFDAAERILDEQLARSSADVLDRRRACLFAERAWCRIRLGRFADAAGDAARVDAAALRGIEDDDLAVLHQRLAQVHAGLGSAAEAASQRERAAAALQRHEAAQARLVDRLDSMRR